MPTLTEDFRRLPLYLQCCCGISLVLLLISLTQPAFRIDRVENPDAYANSLILFLLGWTSFLGGAFLPFILWLANPLYLTALVLTIKHKFIALPLALTALALACWFSLLDSIMTSESGATSRITWRGPGFFLWFASFTVLAGGLVVQFLNNRKSVSASE